MTESDRVNDYIKRQVKAALKEKDDEDWAFLIIIAFLLFFPAAILFLVESHS